MRCHRRGALRCRSLGAEVYTFPDHHIHIVGKQELSGAELLVAKLGLECGPEALLAKRDEFLLDGFVGAAPLPGAVALVELAVSRFGARVAVATSSSREYLAAKIRGEGPNAAAKQALFAPFFDEGAPAGAREGRDAVAGAHARIICGDDAGPSGGGLASKPAPDIFAAAAARVGADPGRCLAVEDSPAGVRAAVAAGMRCVFVQPDARVRDRDEEARDSASLVAASLTEVDWEALMAE